MSWEPYRMRDRSLEQLLEDVDSGHLQGHRGVGAHEDLAHVIAIRVAIATTRWARVSALASVAGVAVAAAALVVAVAS